MSAADRDVNAALRRLQGEVDRLTRERDEAIHAAAEGNGCAQALERQLADSQAECAALREAGEALCVAVSGGIHATWAAAAEQFVTALSRPPGSREALRAMLRSGVLATLDAAGDVDIPCQATGRATGCLSNDPDAVKACMERDREAFAEVIVARLLGPQATEEGGAK